MFLKFFRFGISLFLIQSYHEIEIFFADYKTVQYDMIVKLILTTTTKLILTQEV